MNYSTCAFGNNKHQRGAVLVISLLMLLVLTLIGVSSMGTANLEEKMAGNLRDRELAFQAAEAALRTGERYIEANRYSMTFDVSCTSGFCDCSDPSVGCVEYWTDTTLNVWNTPGRHLLYTSNLQGVNSRAMYIVEYLGKQIIAPAAAPCASCPDMYRVTALASGLTDVSRVMLQSTYRVN